MSEKFSLGNLEVGPGKIDHGNLGSVEMADGNKVFVPLIVANGVEPGPIFTVASAVHGTEVSTIGALLNLFEDIDPSKMKGTLIGIPGANPFALQVGKYTSYIDGENLSNSWFFKAKSTGTITERLAAYIDDALSISDLIVDLHANPLPSINFVMVDIDTYSDEAVRQDTYKMAEAYGVTTIEMPVDEPSTMRACATSNGVPALTAELAGSIYLWEDINKVGYVGLSNIMKAFEMIPGELTEQPVNKMEGDFCFHSMLFANHGGLMWVKKKPGELINKNETAIEITDYYGNVIEEIKMPVTGYCWSFTGGVGGTHAVPEGCRLAYVFHEKK